jgi:hypothetical protein
MVGAAIRCVLFSMLFIQYLDHKISTTTLILTISFCQPGLRDMDTTYFTETSNPLGTFDESLLAIPGIMENIISFV